MNREERSKIAEYIRANEQETYCQLANRFNLSYCRITQIAGEFNIQRKSGRKKSEPTG